MKINNLVFLIFLFCCLCAPEQKTPDTKLQFPERAKDMVIYEVNVRQYTPEGTFNAFAQHLPRLQKMGVDILWIMPIQPIGVEKRKGGLGSYYSIKDYVAVNPEHGSLDDFKALVTRAHDLDMLIILDWVANHTAWDHPWMENESYYTKDSMGNVIPPVPDWSDVADLNYDNQEMQNEMIESMRFWVREADIDGFRCDVAGSVPMEFWDRAADSLARDKDLFMLAEWDDPKMHSAFHMTYAWGMHHQMNTIAKGEKNADSLVAFTNNDHKKFDESAFRMNFTTNHDENSWNGTVFERFGDGHKAYAVLAFTIQGMPLIYSGQEAGLDRRLAFFEKDEIEWSDIKFEKFYTQLIDLKKKNEALFNGAFGARAKFIPTGNSNVIAYQRSRGDNEVTVIINLSNDSQSIAIEDQSITFDDYFTEQRFDSSVTSLEPFQYYIGTKTSL